MTEVMLVLLVLISGLVALGLSRKVNMWGWMTVYWIVLLLKNIMDVVEV